MLKFIRIVLALLAVSAPAAVVADDAGSLFARVATDADGVPRALQLAIVTYASQAKARNFSVDLVSAIHVGDTDYYGELNDRFAEYDSLLYELVAPQGTIVTPDSERSGFVSNAQMLLTYVLKLSFQLDEIDYTRPNFVHADLSLKELSQSMADRNESLYTYFWRIFFASMREYGKDPMGIRDWHVLAATIGAGENYSFKTMFAYEVANVESMQDIFGEDSASAMIGARNARAIEVLRSELDGGAERIGIFYGVGHMADLEQRLLELGLVPTKVEWIDAWQLGSNYLRTPAN